MSLLPSPVRSALRIQFVRFLLVGALNTVFGYSVYALMLFLGVHYAAAALAGQILAVLFNFKTTGALVFSSRDNRRFLRFVGVYALTYGVNVFFLKIFHLLKLDMYLAGALLLLPMAFLAFGLNRRFVFTDPTPPQG